jgi:nicotinate-nucleotide adenylyltransferase
LREDGTTLKVGLFGGTFNPPHLAHLRLAEEVAEVHGLHRVIFIPCFIPPHKNTVGSVDPAHRLAMTARACADNPLFDVSDIEIGLEGPSYTVNTLEVFTRGSSDQIFFIMGTDSLKEIQAWKDYDRLFSLSHFIVVARLGLTFDSAWAGVPSGVRAQFRPNGDELVHTSSNRLIPSGVTGLDISSTGIRDLLRDKRSIRYLVPDAVLNYIMENHLYGC